MATEVPSNVHIDHQAGGDRTVFATWTWSKTHTDHYEVWWEYSTANKGVWFTGSESSENHPISTYSYPDNAKQVRFRVKPVAEKKSGGDTPYWTSTWTKTVTYKIPAISSIAARQTIKPPKDLKLTLEAGTDRTYRATWTWGWSNTEYIAVDWMYYTANKLWFYGAVDTATINESVWTPPANATHVRCRIRPYSSVAYETDTQTMYWWSSSWTSYVKAKLATEPPPTSNAPSKVKITLQNGTDRTLFATWNWTKSKTDHYEVIWQWTTGQGTWFEGNRSNVTVKNSEYTAPDNATNVRFYVRAIAQDGATWSRSATSTGVYYPLEAPEAGKPGKPRIQKESNIDGSLMASWVWDKHNQTDHYNVEWQYTVGNLDANKDMIWRPGGTEDTGKYRSATYSPPSNAIKVRARYLPVASGSAFTTTWSPWMTYTFSEQKTTISTVTKTAHIQPLILEEGTDRTLLAQWEWDEPNTASYKLTWQYEIAQSAGLWFYGEKDKVVETQYDRYDAPSNATRVRLYVTPVAKTKKVQGIDTPYWTAEKASTGVYYSFVDTGEPQQAPTPAILIDEQTLTAEVDIYDDLADLVEFEVVKDDTTPVQLLRSRVTTNHAAVRCTVEIGGEYKVRARAINAVQTTSIEDVLADKTNAVVQRGEWSEYSENIGTVPATPESILWHKAVDTDQVQIAWSGVNNVTGYKIEYATKKEYFDISDQTTTIDTGTGETTRIITGLETGQTYFFRVCAVNDAGQSSWTPNYHNDESYPVVLGTRPSAPTTWTDTTTGVIGESIYLYWTHNSEDESAQTAADVELTINGTTVHVEPTYMSDGSMPSYYIFNTDNPFEGIDFEYDTITDSQNDTVLDDTSNEIYARNFETAANSEGAVIVWRVRTKGVLTGDEDWSEYSAARTVVIYAQPTLDLYVGNDPEHVEKIYELNRYPLLIHAEAFPAVQKAIGYTVSIVANESYETRDSQGNLKSIRDQQAVFEKYYPASNGNVLDISLSAGDVSIANNITYTVSVTATMDSSLSAYNSWTFIARWSIDVLVPDAEVTINRERLSAYIRPFCNDEDGELVDDVLLSVYRLEYDGRLSEIATGLPNGEITITDPHPSLNYARYRVVAMYEENGIMGFRDIPGVYIGETGIVVQWDEEYRPFFTNDGEYTDEMDETIDRGSMLKLPYNIEISDSNEMDVSLNKYIGRAHPVSYYGTQLGIKGGWSGTIRRDDVETIYALRRLAVYRGDAYVREPSGVGYWANVSVSFSKRYSDMVIPVSLDVVRVEGGI